MQWLQYFLNAGACKKPKKQEKKKEENQAHKQRNDAKKEWTKSCSILWSSRI